MVIFEYASHFGNYPRGKYSFGTGCLMADRQLKNAINNETVTVNEIGNAKAFITDKRNGKWFLATGGYGNDSVGTVMLGAICGDVAGSVYEFHNIKYCLNADGIVNKNSHFTDDTVMTCAVANGIMNALRYLPDDYMGKPECEDIILKSVQESLIKFGRMYPYAGYGGSFRRWLVSDDPKPYNSWGNGSAMRASYAGWIAQSLDEAEYLGEMSAKVTHNHPEGIKGAKVVAGSIFILKSGGSKQDVKKYASEFYDIDFTLDEIRENYYFDVSCQGSVPQAIVAFLEGEDFSDVISKAISIGGDSDTIAAIAGSMAEACYPIPQEFRGQVIDKLDDNLTKILIEVIDFVYCGNRR